MILALAVSNISTPALFCFSAAFDMVDHDIIILHVQYTSNSRGMTFPRFLGYLNDGIQTVSVNGKLPTFALFFQKIPFWDHFCLLLLSIVLSIRSHFSTRFKQKMLPVSHEVLHVLFILGHTCCLLEGKHFVVCSRSHRVVCVISYLLYARGHTCCKPEDTRLVYPGHKCCIPRSHLLHARSHTCCVPRSHEFIRLDEIPSIPQII